MKTDPFKILVVYYTQSGQLRQILDAFCRPMSGRADMVLDFVPIEPENDFPFPWHKEFFDCFPESVEGIPMKLKPLTTSYEKYDLVIFGYQPWYLSPSVPASSFLQTAEAAKLLKDTPVVTVIGSRNMWIGAQQIVAERLQGLGANHVGNIVRADRANNWIAGITIVSWLVHGMKKPAFLPEAGVSSEDINYCSNFGEILMEHTATSDFTHLQEKLVARGATFFKFRLYGIEKNARKIFRKFSAFILKADENPKKRKRRVTLFKYYLLFVFFAVSPVASLFFMTIQVLMPSKVRRVKQQVETVHP